MNNYDCNGKKIGHSNPAIFGGMNHYDDHGHKVGSSRPGLFGGVNHYDVKDQRKDIVIRVSSEGWTKTKNFGIPVNVLFIGSLEVSGFKLLIFQLYLNKQKTEMQDYLMAKKIIEVMLEKDERKKERQRQQQEQNRKQR